MTSDNSAVAPNDYTAGSGTLNWTDGDSATKSIVITLIDDADVEGSEMFNVSLSSPSGASLGSPSTATVVLSSDDASPGSLSFAGQQRDR